MDIGYHGANATCPLPSLETEKKKKQEFGQQGRFKVVEFCKKEVFPLKELVMLLHLTQAFLAETRDEVLSTSA